MTTEFNFSRDFKNIIWKSTIFLNIFRAFIAGIIWTIIVWALAPSNFKVEMLFFPLVWPILIIILFPITIIFYKIIPLIGLGMHIIGLILFGPADPVLYLIHKKYPQFVPLKEYPIISFNLVIFALMTDIGTGDKGTGDKGTGDKGTGDNEDYKTGLNFMHNKKYEEAIFYFDKVLAADSNNSSAWFKKGEAITFSSDDPVANNNAINCFNNALKLDPNYADAWFLKGVVHRCKHQNLEAIEALDNALRIKPNDDDAWANKALVQQELGRINEAISCIDNAIKIKPDESFYKEIHDNLINKIRKETNNIPMQTFTILHCEKCGGEIRSGIKYCTNCGAIIPQQPTNTSSLPDSNRCPSCNHEVSKKAKFCGSCGAATKL